MFNNPVDIYAIVHEDFLLYSETINSEHLIEFMRILIGWLREGINYRFFQTKISEFLNEYPDFFIHLPIRIINNCILLGAGDRCVHDLRHTYAVLSFQNGDDIKTVQGNPGHATSAFTLDVYGHVSEKMKEDSAARMQAYIENMT